MPSFKKEFTFDERRTESNRVLCKYPERIPIICEKSNNRLPDIDKKKYLVPDDLTIGQMLYVIRKRLKLPGEIEGNSITNKKPIHAEKALFIFINNKDIASTTAIIKDVYEKHKDPDGFLYLNYAEENVFG